MSNRTEYILLKHMGSEALLPAKDEVTITHPCAESFTARCEYIPDTEVVPMLLFSLAKLWLEEKETVAPGTDTPNRYTLEFNWIMRSCFMNVRFFDDRVMPIGTFDANVVASVLNVPLYSCSGEVHVSAFPLGHST